MKRAFSKWELLAVLAVLVIAAAVLFPTIARYADRRGQPDCQANLKALGLAVGQYRTDFDGLAPLAIQGSTGRGWADALLPYTARAAYRCDDAPAPEQPGADVPVRTDFFYNARLAGRRANPPLDAEYTVLMGDGEAGMDALSAHYAIDELPAAWLGAGPSPRRRHDGGCNFLFEDGHFTWVNAREGIPAVHRRDAWFSFAPK